MQTSKYRPVEFNAQWCAPAIYALSSMRKEFQTGDDDGYCIDSSTIVPTGRVLVSKPGRLPCIEYVKREA